MELLRNRLEKNGTKCVPLNHGRDNGAIWSHRITLLRKNTDISKNDFYLEERGGSFF